MRRSWRDTGSKKTIGAILTLSIRLSSGAQAEKVYVKCVAKSEQVSRILRPDSVLGRKPIRVYIIVKILDLQSKQL